jgi:hypothetical protein
MSRSREKCGHRTGTRRDDNPRRELSPTACLGHRETAAVTQTRLQIPASIVPGGKVGEVGCSCQRGRARLGPRLTRSCRPTTWLPGFGGSLTPSSLARSPKGLEPMTSLFSTPDVDTIAMAVQAAGTAEDLATIAGSLGALIDELRHIGEPSTDRARSAVGRDMVRDAKWSQPVWVQVRGGDGGVTIVAGRGPMRRMAPPL